jgi:hypothetical protein
MAKDRVKMTLLLDGDTINILKKYALEKTGTENVSNAVRMMAKEYDKTTATKDDTVPL